MSMLCTQVSDFGVLLTVTNSFDLLQMINHALQTQSLHASEGRAYT